jgi:hypothetical protein
MLLYAWKKSDYAIHKTFWRVCKYSCVIVQLWMIDMSHWWMYNFWFYQTLSYLSLSFFRSFHSQSSLALWRWSWWWRVTTSHSDMQQWSSKLNRSLSINISNIPDCFIAIDITPTFRSVRPDVASVTLQAIDYNQALGDRQFVIRTLVHVKLRGRQKTLLLWVTAEPQLTRSVLFSVLRFVTDSEWSRDPKRLCPEHCSLFLRDSDTWGKLWFNIIIFIRLGFKLSEKHQLLVYPNGVNILRENLSCTNWCWEAQLYKLVLRSSVLQIGVEKLGPGINAETAK